MRHRLGEAALVSQVIDMLQVLFQGNLGHNVFRFRCCTRPIAILQGRHRTGRGLHHSSGGSWWVLWGVNFN